MKRIRKLLSDVASQTTISSPPFPTSSIIIPTCVASQKVSEFPNSTSPRQASPLQKSKFKSHLKPFRVFSCPAISSDVDNPPVHITARQLHLIACSCSHSTLDDDVRWYRCQRYPCRTMSNSRHGVNTDNYAIVTLSSNNLSRATTSETLNAGNAAPNVIHTRSVVTSPKVAEIGRGRMDDGKLLSKEEREEFMALFPQLVRDITEIPEYRDMEETNRWMGRIMHYNIPHGKRNRGLAAALAYRYLAKELTDDNVKLSYVLGWCVEILQAYFLVADDIMDESETRRGRPCWYKVDNLGVAGFNDALILESIVYMLLKKYFRNKDYYLDLVDVMHEVNHKTLYGQSLDTRTGLEKKLETYTMDRYSGIVKYKTSFYSFYLPVRLAMAMAGINDPDVHQQVRTVTLEMGHFFQVQDDYLDCFGDIKVTGKIGTDIQDSKCSWLFVVAAQKCTPQQKKILWENYGQNDPEKIERVKNLYVELGLPETYSLYEEQTYNLICTHIRQMSEKLPKQLFYDMVSKIYRRKQ